MLEFNPRIRITAKDALNHAYFDNMPDLTNIGNSDDETPIFFQIE